MKKQYSCHSRFRGNDMRLHYVTHTIVVSAKLDAGTTWWQDIFKLIQGCGTHCFCYDYSSGQTVLLSDLRY